MMGHARVEILPISEAEIIQGNLIYREKDRAFAFCNYNPLVGCAALALGTLQIELEFGTGRFLYAWGYSPTTGWQKRKFIFPTKPTCAKIIHFNNYQRGVCYEIAAIDNCKRYYDINSGWFLAFKGNIDNAEYYKFATDTIALILKSELVGIALHACSRPI